MSNVPDDWNCYWRTCARCGGQYHESEGGCECQIEADQLRHQINRIWEAAGNAVEEGDLEELTRAVEGLRESTKLLEEFEQTCDRFNQGGR